MRIHLSKADISDVEEQFVLDALRSGWVAPLGPHVESFEAEIAERCGVAGALALSSGTAALHLALLEVGAQRGTAVIVPTMTFAASANAVVYTGASPVFVDALAEDGNVSPELLLTAVNTLQSEGIPVAAVMTVDLFGRCVDYPALVDVLADHGVPLVEDAAEALGATKNGKPAGSFGRAAALSFNGNKIMTTSGGGMLLSDDLTLLARARYLSTQARQPVPHYEHTEVGYNYRLSNVLAALGRAQLSRLDAMIARRREIRAQYVLGLSDIPGLRFLGRTGMGSDREDNCWLTCITLDPARCPISVDTVIKSLAEDEIEARHLWKPMHLQPVFSGARAFVDGTAEHLFSTGLTLPSGSALSDGEVSTVIDAVRAALGF
jgi:dTDP-4-amino-4,6-dideoxygalactose transaminase